MDKTLYYYLLPDKLFKLLLSLNEFKFAKLLGLLFSEISLLTFIGRLISLKQKVGKYLFIISSSISLNFSISGIRQETK